ncbi:arginine N-methyltransferase 2 [Pseudomassariella vexata]|uniref:Arginine N-methyltransferase 2 n=1 Tax=Pseudomassariella vexata TaxID=1141098 RepID=A0A1Y2DED7_9PEZI|nr:arginine N-methyltransferase 2 [Pseudomassariella vexata]ORY57486.1 arginine N-methyltransferase 2 [Pseudomassariella vexata]
MADTDSIDTRIPDSCPASISEILKHAWHHNLPSLKPLLNVLGRASVQEPTTGETPLHAAIRACKASDEKSPVTAKDVVEELFMSGAIWNDVDNNNETPGCVAARLKQKDLYEMCVAAGVRAELLFEILEGYEALSSADEDEEFVDIRGNGDENAEQDDDEVPELVNIQETEIVDENPDRAFTAPKPVAATIDSEDYLRSNLTYSDGKLVDAEKNGVMMAWETSIMRASVDALLPCLTSGRRILNIGFGMGIIDQMFRDTEPAKHHIIEAHPEVLAYINGPGCKFGKDWEASSPSEGAYKVYGGKWQDVVPKLLEAGEMYDAIYFDTFGEDYSQLRMFFTDYLLGLLEEDGRFGFFNGLGADRQICYDVYTKVVEMHLSDAGMDVEWLEMQVDMQGLEAEGKGEWQGVKRRYWTLDKYRMPVATFMG